MKKVLVATLMGVFLMGLCQAVKAEEAKIVASKLSDRYHLSTCKVAKKIDPQDLILFKTPEEAVQTGLVPCKKCNPPTKSKAK